jgi:hypothetical protein
VAPALESDFDPERHTEEIKQISPAAAGQESLEGIREGLQEAIDQLQKVADQLNRMEQ